MQATWLSTLAAGFFDKPCSVAIGAISLALIASFNLDVFIAATIAVGISLY